MLKQLKHIFIFYSGFIFSQGYVAERFNVNLREYASCGFDGDNFLIEIEITSAESSFFILHEEGYVEEQRPGINCQKSNKDRFPLKINEAFCDTYDYYFKGCCTIEEGDFIIIPDNNFSIKTPNPGANNTVTSITLEATSGYHELVYNWLYFDPIASIWKKFPSHYLGESSITFTAEQLFGSSAHLYKNKSIQYKLELCNGWSPMLPYTYVFIDNSPQLQEPIKTQKTSCNYKNDGMFTMNFDRGLNLGEELVVTLYDGNNDAILIGQNSTSNLVNNGVGYSFSWPSTLDSGSYRVKFQSHNGSGGIPETDSSWNSLEFSDVFVVGQAVPVNFSITSSATESCFDSNDGYIELQGSRESDRSLFYQYSTNGGISYTNWLPFLNTNTTRISGLGKGNYRIKVRDSQNCMAKK